MRSAVAVAVPVIAPRAVVLWALTRLVIAALPLTAGAPFGSFSPPPIAVVVLAGCIGLIDVRVRGERLLWSNLGVPPAVLFASYAAAAVPAEWLLVVALR